VIIVVCLNPALDITHCVPAVDWSGVNRPTAVHARPGGKGLNVARTLRALGTAAAAAPAAGEFSPADYASVLSQVTVRRDGDS